MLWLCKECLEEVEFTRPIDYDGPDLCPECLSVDSLTEAEE